ARERAVEAVIATGGELVAGEADLGLGAAADQLGGGDHAGVSSRYVVVGDTGADGIAGDPGHVGGGGHHHVVAHRGGRQLAGVLQFNGDVGATGRDGGFLQVEAHRIVALECDGAVGCSLGRASGADQGKGEEEATGILHGCGSLVDEVATGVACRYNPAAAVPDDVARFAPAACLCIDLGQATRR